VLISLEVPSNMTVTIQASYTIGKVKNVYKNISYLIKKKPGIT